MSIELNEFKAIVDAVYMQKKAVDAAKLEHTKQNTLLEELKARVLAYLEEHELPNFATETCTVSQITKMSVKVPKELEGKQELFTFLESKYGREVLLNMLSINANTFNSFYNAEEEAAAKKGELDFVMPGVEAPKPYTRLNVRKK